VPPLRVEPGTAQQALEDGYASLAAWVEDNQPRVMRELHRRHHAVWQEIGGRRPVFMSSHAVMHYWTTASRTRQFWNREYFLAKKMKDATRLNTLKGQMQLALAIYDEVSAADLLEIHRESEVLWVEGLKRQHPRVWGRTGKILEKFEAWTAYRDLHPLPRDLDGKEIEMSFRTCQRLAEGSGRSWRDITVADHGEYANERDDRESIYRSRVGQRWKVRPRNWWASLARRVVILTTEVLPTLIASDLPETTPLGFRERRVGWHIVELETPGLPRDEVLVEFDRRSTASGIAGVIERFRKRHGSDIPVISSKATMIEATTNHARAKGSNDLRVERLAQTMIHMSPAEHEVHEVLNAYLGTNISCRLRHVDEFNQSAGRNLGFRKPSPDAQHWLVMSSSLWLKIDEVLCQHSRYDFRLCFSDGALSEIKRKKAEVETELSRSPEPVAEQGGAREMAIIRSATDVVKDLLKVSNQNLSNKWAS
jgi:hypothetical protein